MRYLAEVVDRGWQRERRGSVGKRWWGSEAEGRGRGGARVARASERERATDAEDRFVGGARVQLHRPTAQLCVSTSPWPPQPATRTPCFCSSFSSWPPCRHTPPAPRVSPFLAAPPEPSRQQVRRAGPSHPLRPGPRATTESTIPVAGVRKGGRCCAVNVTLKTARRVHTPPTVAARHRRAMEHTYERGRR